MADKQTTKLLKELNLEDLIPRFLQESITLDIIKAFNRWIQKTWVGK